MRPGDPGLPFSPGIPSLPGMPGGPASPDWPDLPGSPIINRNFEINDYNGMHNIMNGNTYLQM